MVLTAKKNIKNSWKLNANMQNYLKVAQNSFQYLDLDGFL